MIKEKLDEYLEFDSNLLFNRTPILCKYGGKVKRLVRVFGGAIRDIIAGQPINDVDILVGAQSSRLVELTLKEEGDIVNCDKASCETNLAEPVTTKSNGAEPLINTDPVIVWFPINVFEPPVVLIDPALYPYAVLK